MRAAALTVFMISFACALARILFPSSFGSYLTEFISLVFLFEVFLGSHSTKLYKETLDKNFASSSDNIVLKKNVLWFVPFTCSLN